MPKSPPHWLSSLTIDLQAELRRPRSPFAILWRNAEESLGQPIDDADFAAQSAHTLLLLEHFNTFENQRLAKGGVFRSWLDAQQSLAWSLLLEAFDRWCATRTKTPISSRRNSARNWNDYGPFLSEYDPGRRHRRGVFYTPTQIAEYMIHETDRILRDEWQEPQGLGTLCQPDSRWTVSDPAVGSAVFLAAAISQFAAKFHTHHSAHGVTPLKNSGPAVHAEAAKGQSSPRAESVTRAFTDWIGPGLQRISGRDILLPACVLAHLRIAIELERHGYCLERIQQMDIALGDSLIPQTAESRSERIPLIVGNPPFSGLSQNRGAWIDGLMRCDKRGYYSVNGERLRERKLWLNDDYVKFLRVAQHEIESAGQGVAAFVTNHAMIDNATFRGMRWSLQQTFERISILDLHGNRKRGERDSADRVDENVFEIDQGVAICTMRHGGKDARRFVEHSDLWGRREEKFGRLEDDTTTRRPIERTRIEPKPSHFLFSPTAGCSRFELGSPLPEVFPVHTSAPVTARDRVVVAHEPDELLHRINILRDLSISDTEVRARFFSRKADSLQRAGRRKSEYERGDTRGWRLSEARRKLLDDQDWAEHLRPCLYRPFDVRSVYWTRTMIDWPRTSVSRHVQDGDNIVLIARRLTPPDASGLYLWATPGLALDGVIRSDNRGSESLFPLFLKGEHADSPNVSAEVTQRFENRCGLTFCERPCGDLEATFGAFDIASFVYAQLQATSYLARFGDNLRQEFPRVFAPFDRGCFQRLSGLGRRLLDCHLMESMDELPIRSASASGAGDARAGLGRSSSVRLKGPFPRWREGQIELNSERVIGPISEAVWEFRVGSHQVCRKWLKDRPNREIGDLELRQFEGIVQAIETTLQLRAAIPGDVDRSGFWTVSDP